MIAWRFEFWSSRNLTTSYLVVPITSFSQYFLSNTSWNNDLHLNYNKQISQCMNHHKEGKKWSWNSNLFLGQLLNAAKYAFVVHFAEFETTSLSTRCCPLMIFLWNDMFSYCFSNYTCLSPSIVKQNESSHHGSNVRDVFIIFNTIRLQC